MGPTSGCLRSSGYSLDVETQGRVDNVRTDVACSIEIQSFDNLHVHQSTTIDSITSLWYAFTSGTLLAIIVLGG